MFEALVRGALVTSCSPGDQDVLHAQHIIHGAAQRGAGVCTATERNSSDRHAHRFSINDIHLSLRPGQTHLLNQAGAERASMQVNLLQKAYIQLHVNMVPQYRD